MRFVIKILILILLIAPSSPAQKEKDCVHSSQYEKYQSIRFLPVRIKEIEGNRVFYVYQDDRQIILGSFYLTERSQVPKDFEKNHDGRWAVFYCDRHFSIYLAEKAGK